MTTCTRLRDDRGAIIIHVAFALLALLAFSAFVVDMGVMWVSRRQAQNAADAGALAGAVCADERWRGRPRRGSAKRRFSGRMTTSSRRFELKCGERAHQFSWPRWRERAAHM